jgi:5-methylcytosine-specific restriction endonuclease McrA
VVQFHPAVPMLRERMPYKDKQKQKEWLHNRKIIKKTEAKESLGGKCAKCSITKNLEFDHINPKEKSFTIAKNINNKLLKEELKKCQLLCYDCHKEKNKVDNGEAQHGSLAKYIKHKCRCNNCVNNYRTYIKLYRKEQRVKT